MAFDGFRVLFFWLHLLAALSFALAVYFAAKLFRETDRGWYWVTLVLSAVLFALPQWLTFIIPAISPPRFFQVPPPIIGEVLNIAAALLFALSCYGMYSTMHRIRKRVEAGGRKEGRHGAGKR